MASLMSFDYNKCKYMFAISLLSNMTLKKVDIHT